MNVLAIADTQHPFDHEDYLPFLLEVKKKYKCDTVVHVGDEIDNHALGDYDHDPDGYSAGHELLKAIERLKPYQNAFPEMFICDSNHTARILKRAFKSGIPRGYMREFKEVINAPRKWKWDESWEFDGVLYKHGLGYTGTLGALNAAKDAHKPCVIGHLHSDAGILYFNNGKELIFGMNVGCGIDAAAYAFRYGKDCRKKPVTSCGAITSGRPYLLTMNLVKGRWDGVV